MKGAVAILCVLMIIGLSTEWAYSDEPEIKSSPTAKIIWVDGIGSGFYKGLFQVGERLERVLASKFLAARLLTIWRWRQ